MEDTDKKILSFLTTYRCSECLLVQNIFHKSLLHIYLICPNNHIKIYDFNKNFIYNNRIDLSKQICKSCRENFSLFYCKLCYLTLCDKCKNIHKHKNIIKLENIDEEQNTKFYCALCNNFGCKNCIEKNHLEYDHEDGNIDINKIFKFKEDILEKRNNIINDIKNGNVKLVIFDDNLNQENIVNDLLDFELFLYDDNLQMGKIGKLNCISLNNSHIKLFDVSDYYNSESGQFVDIINCSIFEDSNEAIHCNYSNLCNFYYNKLKLNDYYIKNINDIKSLDYIYKNNLNLKDKNEFYLDPLFLQKYNEIECRKDIIFDLYYDCDQNPIIIYNMENKLLFRNINTDVILKQIEIQELENLDIFNIRIKYYKYIKNEYIMVNIINDDKIIIIYDINLNKRIFYKNIKPRELEESFDSNEDLSDFFSCILTTINGTFYLINSLGSQFNITDINNNQLVSRTFNNSLINCIKIFKMDLNYIIIGTGKEGAKCYDFKNSKFLFKFTNEYIYDFIIDDFYNKKHIILSIKHENYQTNHYIYMYEFYSKKCVKIISGYLKSEYQNILLWNHNYLIVCSTSYSEEDGSIFIYDLMCEKFIVYNNDYNEQNDINIINIPLFKIEKIKTEKFGETLVAQARDKIIFFYSINYQLNMKKK